MKPTGLMLAMIESAEEHGSDLAYIPDVVRASGLSPSAAKRKILDAHREGWIQLRPEGGMGRLSRADAELCPEGAGGLPLSWAKVLFDGLTPNRRPVRVDREMQEYIQQLVMDILSFATGQAKKIPARSITVLDMKGDPKKVALKVTQSRKKGLYKIGIHGAHFNPTDQEIVIQVHIPSVKHNLATRGSDYINEFINVLAETLGHEMIHSKELSFGKVYGIKKTRSGKVRAGADSTIGYANSPHEVRAYGWEIARMVANYCRAEGIQELSGTELYRLVQLVGGKKFFGVMDEDNQRKVLQMVVGKLSDEGILFSED